MLHSPCDTSSLLAQIRFCANSIHRNSRGAFSSLSRPELSGPGVRKTVDIDAVLAAALEAANKAAVPGSDLPVQD